MMEQKETTRRRGIAAFILWGAIGFGIGGAIAGSILHFFFSYFWPVALAAMGAVGGLSTGLVVNDRGRAGFLTLAGAIGFGIGGAYALGAQFVSAPEEWQTLVGHHLGPLSMILYRVWVSIIFAPTGALGGAALGLAFKGWRATPLSAVAGAVGFGPVFGNGVWPYGFIVSWAVCGIISGALLGAAIGYLEKRKAMQNTKS